MYYRECDNCGANLDPGEKCDCREIERAKQIEYEKSVEQEDSGQFRLIWEVA